MAGVGDSERAYENTVTTMTTTMKSVLTKILIQKAALLTLGVLSGGALTGCHVDMWKQNKAKPYQESDFFADGLTNRPIVAHTVARGQLRLDDAYYTGMTRTDPTAVGGVKLVDTFPFAIDRNGLKRGQERYNIYCSPCHGATGNGQGMIALRGFALRRQPGNYHTDRLRKMPVGHFFDVITNGYGTMYSYASRITPDDRWKIVAYIRALQLSQNANVADARPQDKPASQPKNEQARNDREPR